MPKWNVLTKQEKTWFIEEGFNENDVNKDTAVVIALFLMQKHNEHRKITYEEHLERLIRLTEEEKKDKRGK